MSYIAKAQHRALIDIERERTRKAEADRWAPAWKKLAKKLRLEVRRLRLDVRVLKTSTEAAVAKFERAEFHLWQAKNSLGRRSAQHRKEVRELKADIERMGRQQKNARDCVLFFSTCIKQGLPWTDECQESINRALAKEPTS